MTEKLTDLFCQICGEKLEHFSHFHVRNGAKLFTVNSIALLAIAAIVLIGYYTVEYFGGVKIKEKR